VRQTFSPGAACPHALTVYQNTSARAAAPITGATAVACMLLIGPIMGLVLRCLILALVFVPALALL
jgi:hypothetical protein